MINLNKIDYCLKDIDGSTRDIDFIGLSKEQLLMLVHAISNNSSIITVVRKTKTETISENIRKYEDYFENKDGNLVFTYHNKWISSFYLFVDYQYNTNTYDVEISYFPDFLNLDEYKADRMLKYILDTVKYIKTRKVFIRYENVSWNGKQGKNQGIICTYNDLVLLELLGAI